MNILVTGGAGFIGSAFIRYGLAHHPSCEQIINLDLLTYAGNLRNLMDVENDPRYTFVKGDVRDEKLIEGLCRLHQIDTIIHFAAESHVDRSITGPKSFFDTNVGGTIALLEVVRKNPSIRFHQVSTDEVFGSLGGEGCFDEHSPYRPNSPYAASKAAADHFVRSYARTFGIRATLSYASNNYGPCQLAEKFVPKMIMNCLQRKALPVYGQGENVRDWLFVEDHARALWMILERGEMGEAYGIGGGEELRNIDLVYQIVEEVAAFQGVSPEELHPLITFVADRPGHDWRYAFSSAKIQNALGWKPERPFSLGLKQTVSWYGHHYAKNSLHYSRTPEVAAFSS